MSSLAERLQDDLTAAMKSRDATRTTTLGRADGKVVSGLVKSRLTG